MVGSANLQKDLELAGRRGRIVVIGGKAKTDVTINPMLLIGKELIVTGVKLADSSVEEWKKMTAVLREGLDKGWIRPVLSNIYDLADAVKVIGTIVIRQLSFFKHCMQYIMFHSFCEIYYKREHNNNKSC